jgi:hypothetical protein
MLLLLIRLKKISQTQFEGKLCLLKKAFTFYTGRRRRGLPPPEISQRNRGLLAKWPL